MKSDIEVKLALRKLYRILLGVVIGFYLVAFTLVAILLTYIVHTDKVWLKLLFVGSGSSYVAWISMWLASHIPYFLYFPSVLRRRLAAYIGIECFLILLFPYMHGYWILVVGLVAGMFMVPLSSLMICVMLSTIVSVQLRRGYVRGIYKRSTVDYVALLYPTWSSALRTLSKQVPVLIQGLWRHGFSAFSQINTVPIIIEKLETEAEIIRAHMKVNSSKFACIIDFISLLNKALELLWYKLSGGRRLFGIVDIKDFSNRRYQLYLIRHAVVTLSWNTRISLGFDLNDYESELKEIIPVILFKYTEFWRRRRSKIQRFHHLSLHHAHGQVVLLDISDPMSASVRGPSGYSSVEYDHDFYFTSNAQIVQIIRNSGQPIAESDALISGTLRNIITQLSRFGLPSVADAYLKFRCSSSGAERYMSLLDVFEMIFKILAIILMKRDQVNAYKDGKMPKWLERPTLGNWLQEMRERSSDSLDETYASAIIICYLNKIPSVRQFEVISVAKDCGFDEVKVPIDSRINWFAWLTDLRNMTKGHGVVSEDISTKLSNHLHAVFLEVIEDLQDVFLKGILQRIDHEGVYDLRGWRRGGTRNPRHAETICEVPSRVAHTRIIIKNQVIELAPFFVVIGNVCLTWLHGKGNNNAYVDPLSGFVLKTKGDHYDERKLKYLMPANDKLINILKKSFMN